MKKHKVFIGVDVSKNKLDIGVLLKNNHQILYQDVYENTAKGIRELLTDLKRKTEAAFAECLFCMEHTGVYTMPLCYFLSNQKIDYVLEPGLQIHRSLGIKRGKSDKADAKDIARYASMHEPELKLYEMPEKLLIKLKVLLTHRERLLHSKKMFSDTSTELDEFVTDKTITREVIKDSRSLIRMLDLKIEKVNHQIQALIQSDIKLKNMYQLVSSIPGVGPQITCYLLVYTRCFSAFENARQFASYAGVAPFEYTSGSSIQGRTKVSQLANKKLKVLLNMGALTAKKLDPELSLYYQRKIKEGKNGMLVMNAIRNKLVARIFATVKRGTPYVPLMKFAG
jgi:transposase